VPEKPANLVKPVKPISDTDWLTGLTTLIGYLVVFDGWHIMTLRRVQRFLLLNGVEFAADMVLVLRLVNESQPGHIPDTSRRFSRPRRDACSCQQDTCCDRLVQEGISRKLV
jgi:hypothetical protein